MMGVYTNWKDNLFELWDGGHALEIAVNNILQANKEVKDTLDTVSSFIVYMGMGE